jgi:hypothetical protein
MIRTLLVAAIVIPLASARPCFAQKEPVLSRVIPASDSMAAKEVLRRTRLWHDAIIRADTAELRNILLPEYSLTVPPAIEQAHVPLEAYLKNAVDYRLSEDRWEASDVRILGDVAVVTSRYWQRAAPGGRDRSGYFILTDVWKRDGAEWRVATRWSTWLDAPQRTPPARP